MKSFESNVYLYCVDCFKPSRECQHVSLNEQLPYDVNEIGAYNITEAENSFSETSIEIYNNTANVNISMDYLDVSSTNLFEAYWDLSYEHGSNLGYGLLKINCSYEIIDEFLKIYINLDYAYDRISPFYNSREFIAYVHPDYTYSIIN